MHVLGWTSLTLWASLLSGVFSLDWLQALPCGFHQTHRDGQHTHTHTHHHTTSSTHADTLPMTGFLENDAGFVIVGAVL